MENLICVEKASRNINFMLKTFLTYYEEIWEKILISTTPILHTADRQYESTIVIKHKLVAAVRALNTI